MEKLTSICPCCSSAMEIERLRCTSCDIAVEGRIPIPRLARLQAEDREFVELFVRSSGSLKAVAEKMGISYPTVRSRLNRVIEALEREEESERDLRNRILDQVEQGLISVDEAVRQLREM
ncbi:MAG: DUF2089 domain-containing protein [Pontiellaceae bacterium]|nr:DUF2089 domain-containing protein [Pontiellaceae bacterium]MBN2784329.1 DUF2089 domain-containing protein [Pontiellaceae bacterium]